MSRQERSALVGIIAFFVAMWLMGEAAVFGGRWQSVAHPTPHATVVLHDGTVLRGAYHVDWDGMNVVEDDAGQAWRFREQDYTLSVQSCGRHCDVSMATHWRAFLPIELVFLGYALFMWRT